MEYIKYFKYKCKRILLTDRKGCELEFNVLKYPVQCTKMPRQARPPSNMRVNQKVMRTSPHFLRSWFIHRLVCTYNMVDQLLFGIKYYCGQISLLAW